MVDSEECYKCFFFLVLFFFFFFWLRFKVSEFLVFLFYGLFVKSIHRGFLRVKTERQKREQRESLTAFGISGTKLSFKNQIGGF